MRETREKVEVGEMKRESLAAVHTHTHTSSFNEQIKSEKAITLVALIVTIIVLIILAGVSISLVIGNNGIMQKAVKGRTDYAGAAINEQLDLNKIEDYIEDNTSNAVKIERVKGGSYFGEPTTVKDTNGNLIKVPKGFKIAADSGLNVTEGIVIEDNDIIEGIGNNRGNQYVWVPVGNGIKKSDGTTVDITLGRYTFANGTSDKDTNGNVLAEGTPTLKQDAANYTQEVVINSYYKELATSRTGVASSGADGLNTTALNLEGFVDSVKANGGYYIARYEASYGTDGKANSKVSNTYETSAPNKEGQLWNNITQINAATASRNLYTGVNSDLINSYAWDTAIVYIQNFSGVTDYSKQDGNSINSSLTNTGVNGDEKCKINDMASNTREWTTEYCTNTGSRYAIPCTYRGGICSLSSYYTASRDSNYATISFSHVSFRCALYM